MNFFRQSLEKLPISEREHALDTFIYGHFKTALLLQDDETVDFEQSFFDLGLTSLTLIKLRHILEQELQCVIDTNTLFDHPKVPDLLTLLKEKSLKDLFNHDIKMNEYNNDSDNIDKNRANDYSKVNQLLNQKFNL